MFCSLKAILSLLDLQGNWHLSLEFQKTVVSQQYLSIFFDETERVVVSLLNLSSGKQDEPINSRILLFRKNLSEDG
ncbi:hypothetical protein Leryth_025590 [Lithospermum erythrorhizon]|uniref:Uncharacterized protein n=1 Tax=Lithospermum erythrorhizon TaxID=34254 RepID=A0AAV3QUA8_LITER|nr:hypothetical protein Leryth_025590 [Lithospermum erythrorhizon]